jgi:hypothetical protein
VSSKKEGEECECCSGKPLKVLAFDEAARFGLINWHRRRYCPKEFRPPYMVRRAYEWTYLYAELDPKSGESFCLYLPGIDGDWIVVRRDGVLIQDVRIVLQTDDGHKYSCPTGACGTGPRL